MSSEPRAADELSRGTARLLVALAAVLWSSSGFFAKSTLFDDWPQETRGVTLAFWRALFAGLLILPAVRRPRWNVRLAPMAVAFATMNVTYLTAMTLTTGASAIWLQNTAPWWVFLAGVLLLGERAERRDFPPLAIGFVGLAVILFSGLQQQSPLGVLAGLGSALSYSAVIFALRALKAENPFWMVAVNHLFTAAVLLPVVLYLGHWPSAQQLAVLAAFGFFQMALPYALFARGLQSLGGHEAAMIALIEPLLLPVWAYLTIGEVPAAATLIGAGLILLGLVLRYTVFRAPNLLPTVDEPEAAVLAEDKS